MGSLALHKETRAPPGAGDKGVWPAPPGPALRGGPSTRGLCRPQPRVCAQKRGGEGKASSHVPLASPQS